MFGSSSAVIGGRPTPLRHSLAFESGSANIAPADDGTVLTVMAASPPSPATRNTARFMPLAGAACHDAGASNFGAAGSPLVAEAIPPCTLSAGGVVCAKGEVVAVLMPEAMMSSR